MRLHRMVSSLAVALVALIGGCSEAVKIPTAYVPFNIKDGTFACQAPEGWENKGGGGKGGPVWAKFASGPALIEIKASATGSLLSDAMGGTPPKDCRRSLSQCIKYTRRASKKPSTNSPSTQKPRQAPT